MTFLIQTRALLWKNSLLFSRKKRILFFMFLTPIAVCCMLNIIIDIGKVLHNSGVLDFPVVEVGLVPSCNNGYYWDSRTEEPCLSVGYSLIGNSEDINHPQYNRYHELMKIFAKNNKYEYNKDVKPITAGN